MGDGAHDCSVLGSDNSFSLPWRSGMPDDTIDYFVATLKSAIEQLKNS